MSHEFSSGFFVGEGAWHGNGKVFTIEDAPSTVREAITEAGCDWLVEKQPIYIGDGYSGDPDLAGTHREYLRVEGHEALTKVGTGEILGIVTPTYEEVQNVEAFNFVDPFIQSGEAMYNAAGALQGGRTVWVLVKIISDPFVVGDGDSIAPYLAITMGHGNGRGINVMFTPIRVVCMNTVRAAEQGAADSMISIRHVGNPTKALSDVREGVRLASRTFEFTADQARRLTEIDCDVDGLRQYVREVLDVENDDEMPRSFERIEAAFEYGDGANLATAAGTRWGAYNAVTNYLEHTKGRDSDSRLRSNWFGEGRRINAKAWKVATSVLS